MMENEQFYIATENYSDGSHVDVSIGNQYKLIENVDEKLVKLKPVDSNEVVVVPRTIVEFMSLPSNLSEKPLTRSQSNVKERISSLNESSDSHFSTRFSTFGHGPNQRERLSESSKGGMKIGSMSKSAYGTDVGNGGKESESDVYAVIMKNKGQDEGNNKVVLRNSEMVGPISTEFGDKWIKEKDNDDGSEVYVNSETGERWRVTYDQETGRQYYYEESLRISLWNLPGQEQVGEPTFAEAAVRPLDEVLEEECGINNIDDNYVYDSPNGNDDGGGDNDGEFSDDDNGNDVTSPTSPHNNNTVCLDQVEAGEPSNLLSSGNCGKFSLRKIKKEHITGPLKNKLMRTEKSGPVEKMKTKENDKDLSNQSKFSKFHMVLTGPELFFYKDFKSAQPKPGQPQGRVELKLKMQNLQFSLVKPQTTSSANYFIQILDSGAPGSSIQYLLRLKTEDDCRGWLSALQYAKDLQRDNMYWNKGGKTIADSSNEPDPNDKQNIKLLLTRFLRKRPNIDVLEAQGIIRPESVFGSSLELLCDKENSSIPEFVYRCILAIEARGLTTNGIYRISGNQAKIQRLRMAVDENKYQLNSDSIEFETLTGAFKLFFKELREPLLDEDFCNKMNDILAARKSDKKNPYKDVNLVAAKKAVGRMKQSHYETAKALFRHLYKVASYQNKNLMDISNLSMVWGPNLYHLTGQASTRLAVILMTRNLIIDFMINQHHLLFPDK